MPTVYGRAVLTCVECGRELDAETPWRAYRVDVPQEGDEAPQLAFYCCACAEREVGSSEPDRS